jgi:hypothetical protein
MPQSHPQGARPPPGHLLALGKWLTVQCGLSPARLPWRGRALDRAARVGAWPTVNLGSSWEFLPVLPLHPDFLCEMSLDPSLWE